MLDNANDGNGTSRPGLKALLEGYEKSLILEALQASGGHQRRTAARLGILPTTLHEKMKRLGLLRSPRPVSSEPMGRVPVPMMAASFGGRRLA
ncbi:MAG TPA: helix-turn-helix domain-containing protein [Vicinamibacteria bacterium]|nr:helix-turn-helix domain-containing protein [Vicinamibacteria bacterium]